MMPRLTASPNSTKANSPPGESSRPLRNGQRERGWAVSRSPQLLLGHNNTNRAGSRRSGPFRTAE